MRSRSLVVAIGMLALITLTGSAPSQAYPERPVRILIAFPAGGTIDTLGRILAQKLTEAWGQNVVIENRPGGGGNIGAAAAAKSAPDGYTIHFGAQSLAVNVTLQPSKDFDPVADFDPIILVGTAQDILLVPLSSPSTTSSTTPGAIPASSTTARSEPGPADTLPRSCFAVSPASSSSTSPIRRSHHIREARRLPAHARGSYRQCHRRPAARASGFRDATRRAASRGSDLQRARREIRR
jgi:hypothetical protein